jgi:quercetin dioxygenase-like cupin family protein
MGIEARVDEYHADDVFSNPRRLTARKKATEFSTGKGRHQMPILKSGDDGNMVADRAQFDLTLEIADSERQKPWPSGIHAKTLYKKLDFRAVLISMEAGSRMKEHHVDGTSSVQMLRGHIRYSAEGQTYDLEAMSLLTIGASIKHDVEAIEASVFLLTISWPANQQLLAMQHRGYGT